MSQPDAARAGGEPLALERTFALLAKLNASMEALAALAAHLGASERPAHPSIAPALAQVARLAGAPAELSSDERAIVVSFARAFFLQAIDLLEHPEREPGWLFDDPTVLECQGRASAVLARLFEGLPGSSPLRATLAREGATFLDVGSGVGWLAIAMARAFPGLRVVGLDRDEGVLELARRNVERTGLQGRVELLHGDVCHLDATSVYDAVWLPGPFLPREVLALAARCSHEALAPGGFVIIGLYGGDDELSRALADLRTVRSGGATWAIEELCERVAAAGFDEVAEVPRSWSAPVRLVTGRKRAS